MTLTEELLSKRELTIFIGVENHSTPYNPLLFNIIWEIPNSLPSKDLLIIPISGLGKRCMLSKEKIICYGRSLLVLFVDSPFLFHYAFLFDSFPQTDVNNYFTNDCISFLQKVNCRSVAVCDIGVYKSRSLINLLNSAISSLGKYNMAVSLVTILGYNSRGYTDVENEDESLKYVKDYYLKSGVEISVISDSFKFIQVVEKFKLSEIVVICSHTKSQAELILQEIKQQAEGYIKTLKPLWDAGFFAHFFESLYKGDSFDFVSLESKLKKMGFKGNLIDARWEIIYNKLCEKIKNSNHKDRNSCVKELISAIGNNINSTISFIKLI